MKKTGNCFGEPAKEMTTSYVLPQGLGWTTIRQAILVRDNYLCVECSTPCASDEADVHHLVPRSAGGTDEPSNLVTLCDGCHAAHHPKLAGRLARRTLERWAVRIALWLDRTGSVCEASRNFGPALRLFGLERFRNGQLPIVQAALNGRSVLVVCPTGFGKTLCFQLPAALRRGVSIVVSPLRALMGEQVSSLLRRKIPSTFINSDLDRDEKTLRYALLAKKSFKLLYLAPERFFVKNRTEMAALRSLTPSYLVIDEAHCVDQWGRDFRPEYGQLREVRKALGNPPVLAFTATAGQEMQQRILASLGVDDAQIFVRGVNRPNIALLRWKLTWERRAEGIAQLCRIPLPEGSKVMIFVPTKKIGETLENHLAREGLHTPFYHSRLGSAWEREQLMKRFVGDSQPAVNRIICTNAFGMGLDVPNVRMVIHWQHPASVEDYMQEFGRAGRDGQQSVAVLFHNNSVPRKDLSLLQFMAKKTVDGAGLSPRAREEALAHKYSQITRMADLAESEGCFRRLLINHFEAPGQGNRNFSTWLLELIFADRPKAQRAGACCDFCHRKGVVERGHVHFVEAVLSLSRQGSAIGDSRTRKSRARPGDIGNYKKEVGEKSPSLLDGRDVTGRPLQAEDA
jgi:ATP-dependent DNA helicase RecQ